MNETYGDAYSSAWLSPVLLVLPPSPVERYSGGTTSPVGVSKLSVGALRNEDQRIGFDEYSWLMACSLPLGRYLTLAGQRSMLKRNRARLTKNSEKLSKFTGVKHYIF